MSLAKRREFLMREKWFSLRDKVDVMDPATQDPVGHFQRRIFSIRTLYRLYDLSGEVELIVQQKLWAVRPTYKFFGIRPRYWFESPDGTRQFEVKGNFFGLRYEIVQDDRSIGSASKTFWAIRDTYGLRVASAVRDQTALLLLGSVIVIHAIHEKRERSSRA